MSFDWRKEYERQFGPLPGTTARGKAPAAPTVFHQVHKPSGKRIRYEKVAQPVDETGDEFDLPGPKVGTIAIPVTEVPTSTAGAGDPGPRPQRASPEPAVEATVGGEVENPRKGGASASPSTPEGTEVQRLADDGGPPADIARVEIAPNRFVNLTTARKLGLVEGGG